MAMTAMVKDELSRVECTKTSERKAEVTALLRFSGGLHSIAEYPKKLRVAADTRVRREA